MIRFATRRLPIVAARPTRATVIAGILLTAGCAKDYDPPPPLTFAVSGQVRDAAGAPLARALVQFVSRRQPSLNMSTVTEADGTFTITTICGNHLLNGAIEGPCRVLITPPFTVPPGPQTVTLPTLCEVHARKNHFLLKVPGAAKKPQAEKSS
jgi:hypothetical protein